MKVRVNWGERNSNVKFRVDAKNVVAAAKFLDARGEWGSFDGRIKWTWKNDAQGLVTAVTLAPSYRLAMPTWPGYRQQSDPVKADWDAMWKALKKHEEGHQQIFVWGLNRLTAEFESLGEAKGGDIDTLCKKISREIREKQQKYDVKTDHGKNQGVTLHGP